MEQIIENSGQNSEFVDFIAAARDDAAMKDHLTWILSFEDMERKLLLGTLIGRMSRGNAPLHLLSAMRLLLNDNVAHTALELLEEPTVLH